MLKLLNKVIFFLGLMLVMWYLFQKKSLETQWSNKLNDLKSFSLVDRGVLVNPDDGLFDLSTIKEMVTDSTLLPPLSQDRYFRITLFRVVSGYESEYVYLCLKCNINMSYLAFKDFNVYLNKKRTFELLKLIILKYQTSTVLDKELLASRLHTLNYNLEDFND